VKTAGPYHLHSAESQEHPEVLTYRIPKGLLGPASGKFYLSHHHYRYHHIICILTPLSIPRTVSLVVLGRLVNNELKKCGRNGWWKNSTSYANIGVTGESHESPYLG
jgi:hypothetical protein